MQAIRNIAVLAHVDAGKTTLSERILFNAFEVRRPGDVGDGLATMDYLPEEKQRGITIESGVAHFEWKEIWFNLIDTPGHVDFGAEVDSALSAADSAVLVVSAAGGVETQTASAWRKLKAHKLRTFVFINKLDNPGYSLEETLIGIESAFGARPILLSFPEFSGGKISAAIDVLSKTRLVHDADGREVVKDFSPKDSPELEALYSEAVEQASFASDSLLETVLNGGSVSPSELRTALETLVASDKFVFCYAGSAKENFSVRSLMTALAFFSKPAAGFAGGDLGLAFRLRYFKEVGEVALFLAHASLPESSWPGGFKFFRLRANLLTPVTGIRAGDIYALRTEARLELGDVLALDGTRARSILDLCAHGMPLLQTHLECETEEDFEKVRAGLDQLSRIDPSLKVEFREEIGSWILHTVGEVQLDVIMDRLRREYDARVFARFPEISYAERLKEPVSFRNELQLGEWNAVVNFRASDTGTFDENTAKCSGLSAQEAEVVRQAILECASAGVSGKGSIRGAEFEIEFEKKTEKMPFPMLRKAATDAFKLCLHPASVTLFEPIMEVFSECPARFAGALTADVHFREGRIREIEGDGHIHSFYAEIPLRRILGYSTSVRSISQGTAIYSQRFLNFREFADS